MPESTPASTAKGSSTRDRIVAAAREKLIQHGVDAFKLRDLADSLGLKLSNLQYYFKTREALIRHVLELEAARDVHLIDAHLKQSGATPEAVLRAIVRDLVVRWRGDTGVLMSAMNTLAMHNPEYRQLYRGIYANFYDALAAPIRQLNPKLDAAEIELRVRLITALVDGTPMQVKVGNKQQFLERVQDQAELIARG